RFGRSLLAVVVIAGVLATASPASAQFFGAGISPYFRTPLGPMMPFRPVMPVGGLGFNPLAFGMAYAFAPSRFTVRVGPVSFTQAYAGPVGLALASNVWGPKYYNPYMASAGMPLPGNTSAMPDFRNPGAANVFARAQQAALEMNPDIAKTA